CLEKDKEKRYQSAGELRSELTNIEKGIPTTERIVPKRKPITSREITVTFGLKKLFIPALVVIAIVIAVVVIWLLRSQKQSVSLSPDKPSIAVLPFIDLSPQKDQTYFCDGIADELINRISRIESIRVLARTSSFSFKGKDLDIRDIGKKLNVETVLEGSVRKAGDKLRITVQLVKVDDGYPLWSEKYDRDMEDIFILQDEISLAIVDNLKVKLLGKDRAKFIKHYTQNLEAYNLYLKGRFFWNKRTEESMEKSVEYFKEAIEEDPEYALAYAGLADSYITLGAWLFLTPKEAYPEAKKAAIKALEIDDLLAEAHNALAYIKFAYDWEWLNAEKRFKRAIALNPNYATAHQFYSEYLIAMERPDEALIEIRRAQKLDPLSLIINAIAGWPFVSTGKYDKAIEQYQKTLEMNPNFRPAHIYLGRAYQNKGMYEKALAEFKIANNLPAIGVVYANMGKTAEAYQVLNELMERSKRMYVPRYELAKIHFALGDNDQGFAWLERAYKEHESGLHGIKKDTLSDSVRSDPRFKALLKKMGLE
ncbi:MAG: tetratricopeptide repeat protein, partial [Candidatus Aminicenantes bacterium]|nr:tetratricopeptide repeat protein [Candidatus Aminicenantes bacterium]